MLEKARDKKVYGELYQMVLGESLAFPDDSFEAVVCVGVFTFGHAPASSLDELVRITKPKGHIIFSQRSDAHVALGFKERQAELESAGRWKLVESDSHRAFSKQESDAPRQVWVYQVM
jgi:SAM-dependent methyltransferase